MEKKKEKAAEGCFAVTECYTECAKQRHAACQLVVLKPLCGECPVSSSTLPYIFCLLNGAQSVAEIQGGIKHLLTMAIIL